MPQRARKLNLGQASGLFQGAANLTAQAGAARGQGKAALVGGITAGMSSAAGSIRAGKERKSRESEAAANRALAEMRIKLEQGRLNLSERRMLADLEFKSKEAEFDRNKFAYSEGVKMADRADEQLGVLMHYAPDDPNIARLQRQALRGRTLADSAGKALGMPDIAPEARPAIADALMAQATSGKTLEQAEDELATFQRSPSTKKLSPGAQLNVGARLSDNVAQARTQRVSQYKEMARNQIPLLLNGLPHQQAQDLLGQMMIQINQADTAEQLQSVYTKFKDVTQKVRTAEKDRQGMAAAQKREGRYEAREERYVAQEGRAQNREQRAQAAAGRSEEDQAAQRRGEDEKRARRERVEAMDERERETRQNAISISFAKWKKDLEDRGESPSPAQEVVKLNELEMQHLYGEKPSGGGMFYEPQR